MNSEQKNSMLLPSIQLQSGQYFDFNLPFESEYTIEDIARALSRICRFGGHTNRFYSVAQHSVLVSSIVPEAIKIPALMHDAAEAFVGDVPSPLKALLPDYRKLEKRVERGLRYKFNLPIELAPEIKEADLIMLATERRDLMPSPDDGPEWEILRNVEPDPGPIEPWHPEKAFDNFITEYKYLKSLQTVSG